MEMVKPSLDEAFVIQEQRVALDFIGKRATGSGGKTMIGSSSEERIAAAKTILKENFLPHIGTNENCETKKAYFLGYMVNRLLSTALGRRELDDRDHVGNKRLDLAGPLMAFLFRTLLKNLLREVGVADLLMDCSSDNNCLSCLVQAASSEVPQQERRLRDQLLHQDYHTHPWAGLFHLDRELE